MTFRESCDTIMSEKKDASSRASLSPIFTDLALSFGTGCAIVLPDGKIVYRVNSAGAVSFPSQDSHCSFFSTLAGELPDSRTAALFSCPCGYCYAAAPLTRDDQLLGTLAVGPFSVDCPSGCARPEMLCGQSVHITPARLDAVLHIVNMAAAELSCRSLLERWENEKRLSLRQNIAANVQSLCRGNVGEAYPVALEKDLQAAILSKDVSRMRDTLNRLLSHIFYAESTAHDPKLILARILELLTLISRSVLDAGADSAYILAQNSLNIQEI